MNKNIFLNKVHIEECKILKQNNYSLLLNCSKNGGGFSFNCESINWDEFNYIVFNVTNKEEWMFGIELKFWSGDSGNLKSELSIDMRVFPSWDTTIAIPLDVLDSEKLYLDRTPGRFKTVIRGKKLDIKEVRRISISSVESWKCHEFELSKLYLSKNEPDYQLPEVKLIDEFGQLTIKDWSGKINSMDELKSILQNEMTVEEMDKEIKFFSHWSKYGGWLNKSFGVTGFFRTEYDGKRWWLVDPDGYPFFSTGLDCVQPGTKGRVDNLERLFKWLPVNKGEYIEAWKDKPDGTGRYFDFPVANLIRVFGGEWWNKWAEITSARLYKWGINTIANWSDYKFIEYSGLPYVLQLKNFPDTEKKIFRDFPDVFSDEYLLASRNYAKQIETLKDDKLMIGYFLRNEPHWAFVDGINIAEILLESREGFVSKNFLVNFISKRYNEDIELFNKAWNLNFKDFVQLKQGVKKAAQLSDRAAKDLYDFSRILIDRYVRIPSQEVRKIDPNHLNLGIRYAYIADQSLLAGSDCFDVFSINCYKVNPAEMINDIGEMVNMPVIIGEFHFGALDRGLISAGLRGVKSQQERGKAYHYYLENCALSKYCVGAHYFVLNDQAGLGRHDGENYQIGFVDVCHQPYQDMVSEVIKTNQVIYQVAAGEKKPDLIPPLEIERV